MDTKFDGKYLLLIETATQICSVGLTCGADIIAVEESLTPNSHSAKLNLLIEKLLKESNLSYKDLSAIALSLGPGSYTGLRIGTSTAKGLAYALEVPIIGIETPKILAKAALEAQPDCTVLAMIDARRMEVYGTIFDSDLREIRHCEADVLTEDYYDKWLSERDKVLLVGDGAEKTRELFAQKKNYLYDETICLSSRFMASLAWEKYLAEEFLDTAYFEPFYLKNFNAIRSQVKGLR